MLLLVNLVLLEVLVRTVLSLLSDAIAEPFRWKAKQSVPHARRVFNAIQPLAATAQKAQWTKAGKIFKLLASYSDIRSAGYLVM
jgi:hypothetical protein